MCSGDTSRAATRSGRSGKRESKYAQVSFGSVGAVGLASPAALTAAGRMTLERPALLVKILQAPAEPVAALPEEDTGA
jgi:hypothetical protein